MARDNGSNSDGRNRSPAVRSDGVSRREFLKLAGVAGASVGMGAGLGGLLAACGEGAETTTTTAGQPTTTTAAATTTTVTTGVEAGREIKVGFVSPTTGGLAAFGIPDAYCVERWKESVADGLVCGDGRNHPINLIVRDSQSDTNRAAQVAGDLITNDQVDIIMACSTPETVNPVADQAEALGAPCITVDAPMEPYYFGRGATPEKPFKWTYHLFWGVTELMAVSFDLFSLLPTNKIVGCLWPNDSDGNAFRPAYTPVMQEKGYTVVDGGPFQVGTEDFTEIISKFKKAGCEIVSGVVIPPDWTNFWKQCKQQGFNPKIVDAIKPTLFPSSMEALGEIGYGLAGPCWFHPTYPFKSSLTGETCLEICLDFEKKNDMQWQQPLMHYVSFEWAVDVLKRVKNIDDKEEVIKAVAATSMADSVAGPFDFTAPVAPGTAHAVPNVVGTQLYGGQWVKGTTQNPWSIKVWPFDLKIVSNVAAPTLTVQQPLQPLS